MCDPNVILRLYSSVLHEHKINHKVKEADIRTAIQNMTEVYKPNPGSLSDECVYLANYNDAGHRCAYLHKYAPFHTALVAEMVHRALQQNRKVFQDIIDPSEKINICSLGGGPGSDIFGVLSVLNATFGLFQVSATVIDCMENWNSVFYDLLTELRCGNYGALGRCVNEQYFDWKYLQHNLLAKMTNQVNTAIGKANLVTMIKFVSASSCKDTSAMIKKIFRSMKPGSLVLYIDNAGGGFHQLMRKEAQDCNMITVFGPLKHELYKNHSFNVRRFGYTPCLETKISVQIWRKTSGDINSHLALNDSSIINALPAVYNINQPKIRETNNFEYKRQFQKPDSASAKTIYRFPSPESTSSQRSPNIPNASLHTVYEYYRITTNYQSSYLPSAQTSVMNHDFNTRHTGTHTNKSIEQTPKQSSIRSQPESIASPRFEPERNQDVIAPSTSTGNENYQVKDDCCGCCVIS